MGLPKDLRWLIGVLRRVPSVDDPSLDKVLLVGSLKLVASVFIELHVQYANGFLHLIQLDIPRRRFLVDVLEPLDGPVDNRIWVEAGL